MISILLEYFINNYKQLLNLCDAIVISKKRDHKYIFLKHNKPDNIIPDKKRFKNKIYIKNGRKLYPVIVDMYELPSVKSGDGDYADIWVVDNLKQAQKQLDLIIKFGAKQFVPKIKIIRRLK